MKKSILRNRILSKRYKFRKYIGLRERQERKKQKRQTQDKDQTP